MYACTACLHLMQRSYQQIPQTLSHIHTCRNISSLGICLLIEVVSQPNTPLACLLTCKMPRLLTPPICSSMLSDTHAHMLVTLPPQDALTAHELTSRVQALVEGLGALSTPRPSKLYDAKHLREDLQKIIRVRFGACVSLWMYVFPYVSMFVCFSHESSIACMSKHLCGSMCKDCCCS